MPSLPGLGELTRDDNQGQLFGWISSPVPCPILGGLALAFHLSCDDEADPYSKPDILQAIDAFLALGEHDLLAASERVHDNYREYLEATDIEPLAIASPEDVWPFVTPTAVRISRRNRRDRDVHVVIECECAWEIEHGLQLVFRRGDRLVRVSEQDGHLTHADAYDLPDDPES